MFGILKQMKKIVAGVVGIFLLLPFSASAAEGSPYIASNPGFDVTFTTQNFPAESFGFAVIGVTRGKAFTENPRLKAGLNWSQFASRTAATAYMNLNAPYGSTVKGHVSSPLKCPVTTVGTTTEPTRCAGYNYGYQAAQHAYAYAKSRGFEPSLWWLDIEEANSWSPDVTVNQWTIQGAIDYLNSKGIRVGIYSVPRMWRDIAGKNFVPSQKIDGQVVSIPTWYPVGVKSLVGAINSCNGMKSFMPGSPIWVVQYEASSTAVDQNIAC